jgi:hypothetical protein
MHLKPPQSLEAGWAFSLLVIAYYAGSYWVGMIDVSWVGQFGRTHSIPKLLK